MIFISNPESSRVFFHCILCKDMGNRARIGCRQYIWTCLSLTYSTVWTAKNQKGLMRLYQSKKELILKSIEAGCLAIYTSDTCCCFQCGQYALPWDSDIPTPAKDQELTNCLVRWILSGFCEQRNNCSVLFIRLQWLYLYLSDNSYH